VESEPPAIVTTLLPVGAFWGIDEKLMRARPVVPCELRGKVTQEVTARVQDIVYR
jgi:hypothetical protein